MRPVARRDDTLRAWSSRYVRLVLDRCQGNKRRACGVLDISYHTLQSHLEFDPTAPRRRPARATRAAPDARAWLDAAG
jgi:transcriptional regulator with AAA-type ATPase domain